MLRFRRVPLRATTRGYYNVTIRVDSFQGYYKKLNRLWFEVQGTQRAQ